LTLGLGFSETLFGQQDIAVLKTLIDVLRPSQNTPPPPKKKKKKKKKSKKRYTSQYR